MDEIKVRCNQQEVGRSQMSAENVVEDNALNTEKANELGNEQFRARNYQAAIRFYSEATSLCPESVTYYSNRAACHIMLKDYKKALSDANIAICINPKSEKVLAQIAKCHVALGNVAEAEDAIKKILKMDPQSSAVKNEQQALQELFHLDKWIQFYYETKAYRIAISKLDSALKYAPACARYGLLKAECLAYLDRCTEAQAIAFDIMKLDSTAAEAVYVYGLCSYFKNNQGLLCFKHALRLDPNHKKSLEMFNKIKEVKRMIANGKRLFEWRLYSEARGIFTHALKTENVSKAVRVELLYNRAIICHAMGAFNDAIADSTNILKIDTRHHEALLLRAKCYYSIENFLESIKDCEALLELRKISAAEELLRKAKYALQKPAQKDCHSILEVPYNATQEQIKKAYKKKALIYHPDRHSNSTAEERKAAEVKFKEINTAYVTLSGTRQNNRYNAKEQEYGQRINTNIYKEAHKTSYTKTRPRRSPKLGEILILSFLLIILLILLSLLVLFLTVLLMI